MLGQRWRSLWLHFLQGMHYWSLLCDVSNIFHFVQLWFFDELHQKKSQIATKVCPISWFDKKKHHCANFFSLATPESFNTRFIFPNRLSSIKKSLKYLIRSLAPLIKNKIDANVDSISWLEIIEHCHDCVFCKEHSDGFCCVTCVALFNLFSCYILKNSMKKLHKFTQKFIQIHDLTTPITCAPVSSLGTQLLS